MPLKSLSALLITLFFFACGNQQESAPQELDYGPLFTQIRQDVEHTFLGTLKPSLEDCQALFNSEESAQKVYQYAQQMYGVIDRLPEDSMKPVSQDAEARMLSASKAELLRGVTNGLPAECATLAAYLHDEASVYGLQYLNAEGTEEKLRTAFFRVGEKWVFIPRPFKAFE